MEATPTYTLTHGSNSHIYTYAYKTSAHVRNTLQVISCPSTVTDIGTSTCRYSGTTSSRTFPSINVHLEHNISKNFKLNRKFRWVTPACACCWQGPWTQEEDRLILFAHKIHGNSFAKIAKMVCMCQLVRLRVIALILTCLQKIFPQDATQKTSSHTCSITFADTNQTPHIDTDVSTYIYVHIYIYRCREGQTTPLRTDGILPSRKSLVMAAILLRKNIYKYICMLCTNEIRLIHMCKICVMSLRA